MTATEFRTLLQTAGLSPAATARLLGHDERTIRKWMAGDAAGDAAVPPTAAILLRLLAAGTITADHIAGAASDDDRRRRRS